MQKRIEFDIRPGACIGAAVLLLLLPLRWVLAAALAAAVHELWHYFAIRLCGGRIYRIRIGAGKAVMETEPLQRSREMICAAAGPLGSFSLLLFARFIPVTAICGLIHGLFNLLPIFPMDGGRIMRCILKIAFPRNAEKVIHYTQRGMLVLILCACIYGVLRFQVWVLSFVFMVVVLAKLLSEKNTLQRIQTEGTIEIH